MTRPVRRIVLTATVAVAVLLVVLVAVAWLAPLPVGNKRVLVDFLLGRGIPPPDARQVAALLKVPPGFEVEAYTTDVPLARFMAMTPEGDLIVSRTRADEVVVVDRDRNGDGRPDGVRVLLGELSRPHGLALHDGYLYVGESTAIGRVKFDAQAGRLAGPYQRIVTGFTDDGHHFTKSIGFGPDGWLYVAQGSSCNVCEEEDRRRATMMRAHADGTGLETFATGLRNSVGFDWAPWDGALYATENARDLLGDDFPPDELNRVERGRFYGWPYVNGFGVPDPDQGNGHADELPASVAPVHGFRPHNAPLGMAFLRWPGRPPEFARAAIVALHGSWNRTRLDGYKVVALRFQPDGSITESDFLTGFLTADRVIGRPAGVLEGPDGAVYVSDDYAGVIYRVTYTGK